MANEIIVLTSDGGENFQLLFTFPISSPATYTDGAGVTTTVVPTPSSTLPALAASVLSAAQKASLDAGTSAYKIANFLRDSTMTQPELVALVKTKYASDLAVFNTQYTSRYRYIGSRITYP